MTSPFRWDHYSDQPEVLTDKAYKKSMRHKHVLDYLKMLLSSLVMIPCSILVMGLLPKPKHGFADSRSFYGMSVNLDKGGQQHDLIEELGVKYLLVRMPLWEMESVEQYVCFAKSFGEDKHILLNILQDREHIDNKDLLRNDMKTIFAAFGSFVQEYQIANTINRTKWGFFSIGEYLEFFSVVQTLRDEHFSHLVLVGPSIIDCEYYHTSRALCNCFPIRFDKGSSLLYVDRRGAPHNPQYGIFDTKHKVELLYAMTFLSPKSGNDIYITEVNWPLSGTAPYAPTSEYECVDEETYARYMKEYHRIVKGTGKVQRVYWHQLIAPGYGLVDNRKGKIRKMPAFYAYKEMVSHA